MWLREKGQVSFEILLLTAIVFASVIWVSGYYLEIKDSTLALQMTKIHAISQIGKSDNQHVLEKLEFTEIAADKINLTIDVPGLNCTPGQFDAATLKSEIMANTKYTTVNIILNTNTC